LKKQGTRKPCRSWVSNASFVLLKGRGRKGQLPGRLQNRIVKTIEALGGKSRRHRNLDSKKREWSSRGGQTNANKVACRVRVGKMETATSNPYIIKHRGRYGEKEKPKPRRDRPEARIHPKH